MTDVERYRETFAKLLADPEARKAAEKSVSDRFLSIDGPYRIALEKRVARLEKAR